MLVIAKQEVLIKTLHTIYKRGLFKEKTYNEEHDNYRYYRVICDESEVDVKLLKEVKRHIGRMEVEGKYCNYKVVGHELGERTITHLETCPMNEVAEILTAEQFAQFWRDLNESKIN